MPSPRGGQECSHRDHEDFICIPDGNLFEAVTFIEIG